MTSSRIVRRPFHAEQRVPLGTLVEAVQAPSLRAQSTAAQSRAEPDHEACALKISGLEATIVELRSERDRLQANLAAMTDQLADLQQDAEHRGYDAGLQRGQQELDRARAELASEWKGTIDQCAKQYEARAHAFQSQLQEIVSVCVAKLLGEHVLSPAGIRAAIEQTLKEAGITGQAKVLIAPLQYEQLARHGAPHVAALRERRLEVAPDGRVATGGCLVETNNGLVDGRFELQLATLRQLIAGQAAPRSDA